MAPKLAPDGSKRGPITDHELHFRPGNRVLDHRIGFDSLISPYFFAFSGGQVEPHVCLGTVLGYALAVGAHELEHALGSGLALLGRFAIPP